jgi:hypothetical protein
MSKYKVLLLRVSTRTYQETPEIEASSSEEALRIAHSMRKSNTIKPLFPNTLEWEEWITRLD